MTLVLLHPIGLDAACWQFLSATFPADAIRYELLWHGDRPRVEGELTLDRFADDVIEETTGPLDLVGVAMGGVVGLLAAIRHPQRVRSLLTIAATAGGTGGQAQLERAEAVARLGIQPCLDETLERWFSPAVFASSDHPGVAYARDRLLRDDPVALAASWRALAMNDSVARLPSLSVPTTVVHAEHDAAGSVDAKAKMVDLLPVARFRQVPGPHMLHLERPDVFEDTVTDHLAWVQTVEPLAMTGDHR